MEPKKQVIDFKRSDWTAAKAVFTDRSLRIFDRAVMEDWETGYMKDLADIAASKGGKILELGYGMGISAKFIQSHDIEKHIIIEANKEVVENARKFAKKAPHQVLIIEGFWEDVIEEIQDNSLDGILFDTYPLPESGEESYFSVFFPFAFRKLKKGGIFTYYSGEVEDFWSVNKEKLIKAGFVGENIKKKVSVVHPPKDCEYWNSETILAPIITK